MLQVDNTRSFQMPSLLRFSIFQQILENRGKFLEFIAQVEYNLRCRVKYFLIFLFLNELNPEKQGKI